MKKLFLLTLLLSIQAKASTVITQFDKSTANGEKPFLAHLNIKNGQLENEVQIGNAVFDSPLVVSDKDSSLLAALNQNEKDNFAEVLILNRTDLKLKTKIKTPKVKWPNIENMRVFPLLISNDETRISVISESNEGVELNIYSVESGEKLFNRKFGKYDFSIFASFDKNFLIFQNESKNRPLFIVIDLVNLKTTTLLNFGRQNVKTFVFGNNVFLSKEMQSGRGNFYKLTQIDFLTNTEHELETFSSNHFAFAKTEDEKTLYIAGKNQKKKRDLYIKTFTDHLSAAINYKKKLSPQSLSLNKEQTRLMVIGRKKLAAINTSDLSLQSFSSLPFDTLLGFMNSSGSLGYFQELSGSRIALVDLDKGKRINKAGAGRVFAKIGNELRKHTISYFVGGLVGALIELQFEKIQSQKNMFLSRSEEKLFVINSTSNDLTIFDANSLDKLLLLSTGLGTFFMYQGETEGSPLLTVGKNQIHLFDTKSNENIFMVKGAEFENIASKENIVLYQKDQNLYLHDMSQNVVLHEIPNFNPNAIYTFND